MAVSLKQFITQLDKSGLLSAQETAQFQQSVTPTLQTAEEFAKQLVKQKKLTKFQAQMIYQGKGKHLQLGNYLLLDKIGAGGMGDVYLAEHRRMKRQVALKTLPTAMTKDDQAIQRFHREVQAAAKLTHQNIVTAYDADESNGVHYFAMEHVAGVDLAALVKKNGLLNVEQAINFILQAAAGLKYAHEEGIIHRDIKPSNMLLDTKGTIKILDMGLARIDNSEESNPGTALTQSGSVMGTVDYMSPEQAQDTHTADARSDIYSLGCSLYFLLTGDSVYGGQTVVNRILAHRDQPIPSLSAMHTHVPADVDAVYQKMIAKKPEDRYLSMSEVIDAFEHCSLANSSSTVSAQAAEVSDPELQKFLLSQQAEATPTIVMNEKKTVEKKQKETLASSFLDQTIIGSDDMGSAEKPQAKPRKTIRKKVWIATGGALAVLLLLAGIFIKVETPAGTIILEINQPELAGAVVSIDDQKKITIKTGEGKEPIEVTADEKTHTLKVTKGGFETFTKQFTVKAGGKETIKVRLMPLAAVKKEPSRLKENYALEFDGKTSYANFPNLKINLREPFTIDLFVKLEKSENTSNRRIRLLTAMRGFGIHTTPRQDKWTFGMPDANEKISSKYIVSQQVISNQQTHLAGVWNGKQLTFFVDGKQKGAPLEHDSPMRSVTSFVLGSRFYTPRKTDEDMLFRGIIDEVRISNTARYTKDFTPAKRFETDKHTMALYHFDEAKGNVLKDSSGNNHHGKIVGAKWVKVDDELKVIEEKPKENYALEFDGKTSYVEVPTLKFNADQPFTLELLIRPAANYPKREIADVLAGWAGRMRIGWSVSDRYEVPKILAGTPGRPVAGYGIEPALSRPIHVAAIWTGHNLGFYVNGRNHYGNGKPFTQFPAPDKQAMLRFLIGATMSTSVKPQALDFFRGIIDEVRISNTARYTKDFTPAKRFETDKHTMALYHFDEAEGDVLKDSSGNNHHGKIVGAKWVKVDDELRVIEEKPKENYALEFDGKTSYVELPVKREGKHPFTFECVVKYDFNPETNSALKDKIRQTIHLMSNRAYVDKGMNIHLKWEKVNGTHVYIVHSKTENFHSRPIPKSGILHIAVIVNGKEAQFYLNGETLGKPYVFPQAYSPSKQSFYIGCNVSKNGKHIIPSPNDQFRGIIDEVRISNTARYTKDFTPAKRFETDKHTMALYHFDEAKGNVLKDSSGNNHHGKIVGAKWVQVDDELKVISDNAISLFKLVWEFGGVISVWDSIKQEHIKLHSQSNIPLQELSGYSFLFKDLAQFGDEQLIQFASAYRKLAEHKSISIDLSGTAVSAKGVKSLAGLPIHSFMLDRSKIIDDEIAETISKFTQLKVLGLQETGITDKTIQLISKSKTLYRLNVKGTVITSSCVPQLEKLNLLFLNISNTSIDKAAVTRLHNALPKCEITWNNGVIPPPNQSGQP